MKEKKKKFGLKELLSGLIFFLVIFAAASLTKKETKLEPEPEPEPNPKMDVTTRSIDQPGIEPAKFYLVKSKWIEDNWGYDQYLQFKDAKDDGILDQVALVALKDFFEFSPETGYPADKVFDSSSPDWEEWLRRFDLVRKEHAKKLERQRQNNPG